MCAKLGYTMCMHSLLASPALLVDSQLAATHLRLAAVPIVLRVKLFVGAGLSLTKRFVNVANSFEFDLPSRERVMVLPGIKEACRKSDDDCPRCRMTSICQQILHSAQCRFMSKKVAEAGLHAEETARFRETIVKAARSRKLKEAGQQVKSAFRAAQLRQTRLQDKVEEQTVLRQTRSAVQDKDANLIWQCLPGYQTWLAFVKRATKKGYDENGQARPRAPGFKGGATPITDPEEQELSAVSHWQRTDGPFYVQFTGAAMLLVGFLIHFALYNHNGSGNVRQARNFGRNCLRKGCVSTHRLAARLSWKREILLRHRPAMMRRREMRGRRRRRRKRSMLMSRMSRSTRGEVGGGERRREQMI